MLYKNKIYTLIVASLFVTEVTASEKSSCVRSIEVSPTAVSRMDGLVRNAYGQSQYERHLGVLNFSSTFLDFNKPLSDWEVNSRKRLFNNYVEVKKFQQQKRYWQECIKLDKEIYKLQKERGELEIKQAMLLNEQWGKKKS